ncbi:hypothetical protein SLEP1_g6904 [Rubroshorea leprosula]|uniref:Uncharacterized protein n=1 Tax=Rubroshorea leprosula TaxID=152421 RepID=A0AAV5I6I7_9ROSI|nr:hypothetical protein SLEP1_g6904 [Rubroshorea leprosula]
MALAIKEVLLGKGCYSSVDNCTLKDLGVGFINYFKNKNKKIKHDSLSMFSHSLEQCIIHLEGNLQHTLIRSPRYDVEVDLHMRYVDLDSMNEGANLGHGEV